jgi:ATP-dependent DNA helicase RecG
MWRREEASALTLDSPIVQIDQRLGSRRFRKGPPAHRVLSESLGVETVADLLRHYPRRYIDRSATVPIRAVLRSGSPPGQSTFSSDRLPDIRPGQEVTVIGDIWSVAARRTRRGQSMVSVVVADETGRLEIPFFNQPWIARSYRKGMEVAVSGRVDFFRGRAQLANHAVEILRGDDAETVHTGRITPVHPASEGVTTRTIRELVFRALQLLGPIADPLPSDVLEAETLAPEDEALRAIHFPEEQQELARARDRLKFDELFSLELGVAYRKRRLERAATGASHSVDGELAELFVDGLPFEPTGAQRRAMKEVGEDMAAARPMNRLLQGDVGSGKTAVALYAAMVAVQSGHQATIMAPTEVLAGQHLRTVRSLLASLGGRDILSLPPAGSLSIDGQQSLLEDVLEGSLPPAGSGPVTYAFLTSAVTGKDRQRVLDGIRDGSVDLVIGTHALVQEGVEFADLSFVVIDEQHRFGVHQRISLKEKGAHPDVLIMTATPIPRTLALTYYGDLDVSVLDEMPAGREPVTTNVARTAAERSAAYGLVREQIASGRQAFVVCAAIDEGNRLEVKAAEKEAERLATKVFPDLRISLLHGRMRPGEKDAVMEAFRAGGSDVLISTTVIEVGVDVPNATVMLVENAERFGLAQLHQLRGRIGRGGHASHCVLFDESGPDSQEARARLAAMERTTDGFELADEDLRLRGEGTLFDIKQSGMPDLKLARLAEDTELVGRARTRAFALIDADPELEAHPELLRLLHRTFTGDAIDWLFHT